MERIAVRPAYSITNFCHEFDIGRTLAYEEIKRGRLKTFKVGKRTLIAGEDAVAWRDQHRGRQPEPKRAA